MKEQEKSSEKVSQTKSGGGYPQGSQGSFSCTPGRVEMDMEGRELIETALTGRRTRRESSETGRDCLVLLV